MRKRKGGHLRKETVYLVISGDNINEEEEGGSPKNGERVRVDGTLFVEMLLLLLLLWLVVCTMLWWWLLWLWMLL